MIRKFVIASGAICSWRWAALSPRQGLRVAVAAVRASAGLAAAAVAAAVSVAVVAASAAAGLPETAGLAAIAVSAETVHSAVRARAVSAAATSTGDRLRPAATSVTVAVCVVGTSRATEIGVDAITVVGGIIAAGASLSERPTSTTTVITTTAITVAIAAGCIGERSRPEARIGGGVMSNARTKSVSCSRLK